MKLDEVDYRTLEGGIAEIVLDRPETRNALSARAGGTRDQIAHALDLAEADPDVRCVVLRGAGVAFSAGGDLTGNAPRQTAAQDERFLAAADAFHRRVRASTVPVIAAVHGYCLGAGLVLACSCDLVVAGQGCLFGFPEGRLGMVGVSPLVTVIGRQWAKMLMITGELIPASTAQRIGLVLAVEPDDALVERVGDLARRIARMPAQAVLLNRRCIDAVADAAGDEAGRIAAHGADAVTAGMAREATAPDGRTFRSIIADEGMAGLKAARQDQYSDPWLLPLATDPG